MKAKDAIVGRQYKSQKGKIVELLGAANPNAPSGAGIPYKYISETGDRTLYGRIPGDYELIEIEESEKVNIKPEKVEANAVRALNLRDYVRRNINSSVEEIVSDIKKKIEEGVVIKCKRPIEVVVKEYVWGFKEGGDK